MINISKEKLAELTASEFAALVNQSVRESGETHVDGWCGLLAESADHWAEYNIHTGEELADYLDAVARQDDDDWAAAELEGDIARDMGWD